MRRTPVGRRRRPIRIVGALICSVVLCATACSGAEDPADDGTDEDTVSTTTEAPVTTAPVGAPLGSTEVGLRDLEAGQCFETIDDPLVEDLAVWLVPCTEPHTYEVYDLVDYEGIGADDSVYPGAVELQNWSEQACFDRFEPFIGVRWTLSEFELQLWWPSQDSWSRGDRTVICAVLAQNGDKVTGTQRNVGR